MKEGSGKSADNFESANSKSTGKDADKFEHTVEGCKGSLAQGMKCDTKGTFIELDEGDFKNHDEAIRSLMAKLDTKEEKPTVAEPEEKPINTTGLTETEEQSKKGLELLKEKESQLKAATEDISGAEKQILTDRAEIDKQI